VSIALKQGSVITDIGPGGILHSLFSTIAVRLEGGQWGERYPVIMDKLYQGVLGRADAVPALTEMRQITEQLSRLDPTQVVWDIEEPDQEPPWGLAVGPHVGNMANYHVTPGGRNLIKVIIENLESLRDCGGSLEIVPFSKALFE
jgi:2,3-bisphosphoglycerate-dependent phosphoglycerate mutase